MKKTTIICQRQFDDHLVDGRLTLFPDKLHFEAHYPNKQRVYLPLHSILGINVQEGICLLLLTKTGIVRFFIQLNDDINILKSFAQNIREQQHNTDKSFSITSHFEYFLELQMGSFFSSSACSIVIKKDFLLVYSEEADTQKISMDAIQKNSLTWTGLVNIQTQEKTFSFLGASAFQLYALIDIYQRFGENEYIRNWTDHYAAPFRLSLDCFVVQTEQYIHIYPPHFWLKLGIKPIHIQTQNIHELEFQTTHLAIHAKEISVSLIGMYNLGFYRKACEHIAKSNTFFFQGKWRDVREKLPKYEISGEDISLSSASLWRHDRHILQGYLVLDQDFLYFLPLSKQLNFLKLSLDELIREDDTSTARNILYLRDQENIYQIICPNEEFVQHFHQQTQLPNRRLFWEELSPTIRRKIIHKQRALLRDTSKSVESQLVELLLEEDAFLAQTLKTSLRFPSVGAKVQLSFTNSSGRHFFHSTIKYIIPERKDQAILEAPKVISLYSERETKRYTIGTTISLAPLKHNAEKGEWLPKEEILIGTLLDISETGCGITLSIDKFEYSRILLEIPTHPPIQLVGEISQVQSFIQGGLRLGILFIADPPTIRFQLQQIIQELA